MLITSKNYNNINLHLVEDVEDVEKFVNQFAKRLCIDDDV